MGLIKEKSISKRRLNLPGSRLERQTFHCKLPAREFSSRKVRFCFIRKADKSIICLNRNNVFQFNMRITREVLASPNLFLCHRISIYGSNSADSRDDITLSLSLPQTTNDKGKRNGGLPPFVRGRHDSINLGAAASSAKGTPTTNKDSFIFHPRIAIRTNIHSERNQEGGFTRVQFHAC